MLGPIQSHTGLSISLHNTMSEISVTPLSYPEFQDVLERLGVLACFSGAVINNPRTKLSLGNERAYLAYVYTAQCFMRGSQGRNPDQVVLLQVQFPRQERCLLVLLQLVLWRQDRVNRDLITHPGPRGKDLLPHPSPGPGSYWLIPDAGTAQQHESLACLLTVQGFGNPKSCLHLPSPAIACWHFYLTVRIN